MTDECFGHVLTISVLESHILIELLAVSIAYRLDRYWVMSPERSPDEQYSI